MGSFWRIGELARQHGVGEVAGLGGDAGEGGVAGGDEDAASVQHVEVERSQVADRTVHAGEAGGVGGGGLRDERWGAGRVLGGQPADAQLEAADRDSEGVDDQDGLARGQAPALAQDAIGRAGVEEFGALVVELDHGVARRDECEGQAQLVVGVATDAHGGADEPVFAGLSGLGVEHCDVEAHAWKSSSQPSAGA